MLRRAYDRRTRAKHAPWHLRACTAYIHAKTETPVPAVQGGDLPPVEMHHRIPHERAVREDPYVVRFRGLRLHGLGSERSMRSVFQRFGRDSKWSRYSPELIACLVSMRCRQSEVSETPWLSTLGPKPSARKRQAWRQYGDRASSDKRSYERHFGVMKATIVLLPARIAHAAMQTTKGRRLPAENHAATSGSCRCRRTAENRRIHSNAWPARQTDIFNLLHRYVLLQAGHSPSAGDDSQR